MNDHEIIKAVHAKAIRNGWKPDPNWMLDELEHCEISVVNNVLGIAHDPHWSIDVDTIIFNHDFAKAFWGDPKPLHNNGICSHCNGDINLSNPSGFCDHIYFPERCETCLKDSKGWQYHLPQLAITKPKDRVKYLEGYL